MIKSSPRTPRRPTHATIVAYLALFAALAGSAYAVTLKKNSVRSRQIKNGQVKSVDVADGGVAAVDIGNGQVGPAKLADGAVERAKVAAGAIGPNEIATGAIDGSRLADGAVDGSKITDAAVGAAEIADGSIGGDEVAANAIGGPQVDEATLAGVTDRCPSLLTNRLGDLCVSPAATDRDWVDALTFCADREMRLPTLAEAVALARGYDVPGVAALHSFWTEQYVYGAGDTENAWGVTEEGQIDYGVISAQIEVVCVSAPTDAR